MTINRSPPSLLKSPSLRRASPSFQNLSPWHRSFQLRTMRNVFQQRVGGGHPTTRPLGRKSVCKLYIQSHVESSQLAHLRSSLELSLPLLISVLKVPFPSFGSFVTSFTLRNSDTLPILHVGKVHSRWKTSARIIPDLSHRSGEPVFSMTSPLKFMAEDKVQSGFAVKETGFQYGCSNLPGNRSRSCTYMVGHSIVHHPQPFKTASTARRFPQDLSLSSLPKRGAQPSTLFVLQLCADLNTALSPHFITSST